MAGRQLRPRCARPDCPNAAPRGYNYCSQQCRKQHQAMLAGESDGTRQWVLYTRIANVQSWTVTPVWNLEDAYDQLRQILIGQRAVVYADVQNHQGTRKPIGEWSRRP